MPYGIARVKNIHAVFKQQPLDHRKKINMFHQEESVVDSYISHASFWYGYGIQLI